MYLTQIFMDVCTSLCLNGDTRPKLNNYNKIKIWSNFKNFGLPALEVKLLWEITWDSSVVLLVIFRRLWPRKLEILLFVFPFLLDLYEQKRTYFWITCFYVCKVIGCLRALCGATVLVISPKRIELEGSTCAQIKALEKWNCLIKAVSLLSPCRRHHCRRQRLHH